jgi:hypothetical protein
MGLDGSGASLLGCGVSVDTGRGAVKAFFARLEVGVCELLATVESEAAGLGEIVDFFWKKPKMDF